ncbi:23S rRNA (pseudouridine(1915)-N(3))-methyltransferase RlmH [Candidatus Falkowbacteria bacterium]|nr:23S rRNA (pseudouridine(1915)-N(3))-methyltransferase RlmH [Candidatus Falkowbacteria bacterium]
MLDITLISVGKIKDKNLATLAQDYIKRLKPFAKLKIIEVEASPIISNNQTATKVLEGERLLKIIKLEEEKARGGVVYLLAERGKIFNSSPDLAAWLNKNNPLILVLGGALGFSDDLYKNYPQISLSPLTFPHELARVIFLEQFYRASLINMKKAYHY